MGITHAKVTAIVDDANYDVGSDEWNDDHVVTASDIPIVDSGGLITATNVETALAELDGDLTTHAGAADPHTGYRLESADHTHATTGLQGGTLLASNIPIVDSGALITATNVETALAELAVQRPPTLWAAPLDPRFDNFVVAVAANTAYLAAFAVDRQVTATRGTFHIGTSSGNMDIGLYSAAGARLGSSGATATTAGISQASVNLSSSVVLEPGLVYWSAVSFDNATASIYGVQGVTFGNLQLGLAATVAASYPLPASVILTSPTARSPNIRWDY